MRIHLLLFIITILVSSCTTLTTPAHAPTQEFHDYWYAGAAELNTYDLKQERYGEIREGQAILIFVTEDFDTKEHVKHERGPKTSATSVLKLNEIRRFETGIYDYSVMNSIFTPVNEPTQPLKITQTSQDWCGHTFMQLNKQGGYEIEQRSYFQNEGDQNYRVADAYSEQGFFTTIRISPSLLPQGEIQIIPSTIDARFNHYKLEPKPAKTTLQQGEHISIYTIEYKDLEREVEIEFQTQFPHKITKFSETGMSGFGDDAKELTTIATLRNTLQEQYWSKHDNKHEPLREKLGVASFNSN